MSAAEKRLKDLRKWYIR